MNTFSPFSSFTLPARKLKSAPFVLPRLLHPATSLCAAFALAGCANNSSQTTQPALDTSKSVTKAAIKPEQGKSALETWAGVLNNWAQGKQAAPAQAKTRPQRQPVYVDIAAVARRHPAWQLAVALERESAPRRADVPVRIPNVANVDISDSFASDIFSSDTFPPLRRASTNSDWRGVTSRDWALPLAPETLLRRETALGLGALQEYSKRRQLSSIERFLEVAGRRDEEAIVDRATALNSALGENITVEVEALRRRALAPLATTLPPEAVQLEMTNLRLRLQNLSLTAAEREQAQAQLDKLEAQWREELRAQEAAQRAQLEASQRELPQQRRSEGAVRIAKSLAALRDESEAARQEVRTRQLGLVNSDFDADNKILGIAFPPQSNGADSSQVAPRTFFSTHYTANTAKFETSVARNASIAHAFTASEFTTRIHGIANLSISSPNPAASATGRAGQIAALKARALREARLWTQSIARQKNWQLQQNRISRATKAGVAASNNQNTNSLLSTRKNNPSLISPTRDATGDVIRILQLG